MRNKIICVILTLLISFAYFSNHQKIFATGTAISTCEELRDMSPLSGSFYLTQDIDCSATSTWNGGNGWIPLGTFTGTLDGRGFAITDLYINRGATDNIGLFSIINGGYVFDLSLTDTDIAGKDYVGALAGTVGPNATIIENITISGSVSGDGYAGGLSGFILNSAIDNVNSSATVTISSSFSYAGGLTAQADDSTFNDTHTTGAVSGPTFIGGLIGLSNGSSFDNCSATGSVTGVYNQGNVGGLIASTSNTGTIENCSASGNVSGGVVAGGLVGTQSTGTTIDNSYATGSVSNSEAGVGGLVGVCNDQISNSYATGNVTGQGNGIGGLVGENYSTVIDSWASGTVTSIAGNSVGGLIGYNNGTGVVRKSYATGGGVSSSADEVGGLVGANFGTIEKSYSTKNVEGNDQVGGLSGNNYGGTINNCYATGNIGIGSEEGAGGGLVGAIGGGTITNSYSIGSKIASPGTFNGSIGSDFGGATINDSYWDIETSAIGSSEADNFGATGKTTTQMKTLASFSTWNISQGSDYLLSPTIWFMGDSYPKLYYTPLVETITVDSNTITQTTVTLRGELKYYFGVEVYFQYREVGSSWTNTSIENKDSLGIFTKDITNLLPNTNYEFRSVVDYNTGIDYGEILSFSTLEEEIIPTPTPTLTPTPTPTPTQTPTNNNSSSTSSSPSTYSCTNSKPLSISDLFEIRASKTSAKLFFTPLTDTSEYYISFSEQPNAEKHGEQVTLLREGVQSHTIYYLKPNTIYYIKVRGQNGCMPGDWSNIMKIKTTSSRSIITFYKNQNTNLSILKSKINTIIKPQAGVIENETPLNRKEPSQTTLAVEEKVETKILEKSNLNKKCFLFWCW